MKLTTPEALTVLAAHEQKMLVEKYANICRYFQKYPLKRPPIRQEKK